MSSTQAFSVSAAALLALGVGCSSTNQSNGDRQTTAYSQLRQEESASERQEFIAAHREELKELETEIARMEARLQHEGQYVDAEQRAEWSQELFELRQQQNQARAELERAQNATPAEWAEMRGALGNAVDSLQAGVGKLAREMGDLFESEETAARQGSQPGIDAAGIDLCEVQVDVAGAELSEEEEKLVVSLTGADPQAIEELRDRAARWHRQQGVSADAEATEEGRMAGDDQASRAAQAPPLIEDISVEDIQRGVRVTITPAEGQRAAERAALE